MNLSYQESTSASLRRFEPGDLVQYVTNSDVYQGAWISVGSYGIVLKVTTESRPFDTAKVYWIDDDSTRTISCTYLKRIA
tara:strand:+ start:3089 stop:3328 length:240 start_codon:yes stop_codon:yes gene_type:complete